MGDTRATGEEQTNTQVTQQQMLQSDTYRGRGATKKEKTTNCWKHTSDASGTQTQGRRATDTGLN